MIKSILCTCLVLFLAHQVGKTQVVVNSDGTHSVITGNVVVNPDGTHSVISGNLIINPNGTHSVMVGNMIVNPNGTHSLNTANALATPKEVHSTHSSIKKSVYPTKRKSTLKSADREAGDFEKWLRQLFGKSRR